MLRAALAARLNVTGFVAVLAGDVRQVGLASPEATAALSAWAESASYFSARGWARLTRARGRTCRVRAQGGEVRGLEQIVGGDEPSVRVWEGLIGRV